MAKIVYDKTKRYTFFTDVQHLSPGTTSVTVNFTLFAAAGATPQPIKVKFGLFYFNNVVSNAL